jgi:cytochrome c5
LPPARAGGDNRRVGGRARNGAFASGVALALLTATACGQAEAPFVSTPLAPEQARIYQAACATCHARAGIGAPLTGVEADWRARREKGMDALLESTVNGFGGMPPLGTCGLCSVDDFRALIRSMAGMP